MDSNVGAYEAKTHLAALLDRVEGGETLTVTRNGRRVARLVPAGPPRPMPEGQAIALIERFRELRETLRAAGVKPFTTEELVKLVHAGRKYRTLVAPALVLDASVPLGWALPDDARAAPALGVLASRNTGTALVPAHWRAEVGNGLLMALRRGRLDPDRLPRIPAEPSTLPVAVDDTGARRLGGAARPGAHHRPDAV